MKKLPPFLGRTEIEEICGCKRSKAFRIIHKIGPVYFGRTPKVPVTAFFKYLQDHNGEIKIDW